MLFTNAITNMMESLELDAQNTISNAINTKRDSIKKSGCSKPFNTLPISSKIRITLKEIERSVQKLKIIRSIIALEINIRSQISKSKAHYKIINPITSPTKKGKTPSSDNIINSPKINKQHVVTY